MINADESQKIQELFSVNEAQVNRDHAISHALAAFQQIKTSFIFFGGTALSRTFLAEGRLSEDIDLYSSDRQALCLEMDGLPNLLEEEFPQANWNVLPSRTKDSEYSLLVCDSSIQIRVQIVDSNTRGWQKVPTELSEMRQRYSDAPPAKLFTPTFDGFVAMKVLAWFDRRTPRDLFDLEGLSWKEPVTENARKLIEQLRGFRVSGEMMNRPVVGAWREELAHQTKLKTTAEESLRRVLEWWGE